MKNSILFFPLLLFLFLLLLVISLFISYYFPLDQALSIGITADLVLTLPLSYLMLIWYKKIPKTTVVFVLSIGVFGGSFLLSKETEMYLDEVKVYLIPLVEIIVLIYILYKVVKAQNANPKNGNLDFHTRLLGITRQLFSERIAYFVASECSVFYYCFFSWKRVILNENQFSYHQKSGSVALLWVAILLLIVETLALHLIISLYSVSLAWILTFLSIYTCLQLFSLIKSMKQRPIEVINGILLLKYGTLCETQIPLSAISCIRDYNSIENKASILVFSPLGQLERPNLCLEFQESIIVRTILGAKKEVRQLLLAIDEVEEFKTYLNNHLV